MRTYVWGKIVMRCVTGGNEFGSSGGAGSVTRRMSRRGYSYSKSRSERTLRTGHGPVPGVSTFVSRPADAVWRSWVPEGPYENSPALQCRGEQTYNGQGPWGRMKWCAGRLSRPGTMRWAGYGPVRTGIHLTRFPFTTCGLRWLPASVPPTISHPTTGRLWT